MKKILSECRLLRIKILTCKKFLIVGDEKYFTFSNSSYITNEGFHTQNKMTTPKNIESISKMKLEPKVCSLCLHSEKGASSVWVQTQKGIAVKSSVYIKKLLPNLIK